MNENKQSFEELIKLFQSTHLEMQKRVAKSVDISLVVRNWLFGWYIVEFEQVGTIHKELYGTKLIKKLSERISIKGCSQRNMASFVKFYKTYSDILQAVPARSIGADISLKKILQAMPAQSIIPQKSESINNRQASPDTSQIVQKMIDKLASSFTLGWTHYVTLLTISDKNERKFYEIETANNSWGYRELERQINSSLYERLVLSKEKNQIKELSTKGQIIEKPSDIIKNPYILEFTGLEELPSYSEHQLETAIKNGLEKFLLELGKGFLFEARQKRFTYDNNHFYVDLVFYNRLLQSYVLIDLKRKELTHQDIGQMQMYVNYFDRHVKTEKEKPTIGILLCHRKNDALVEVTLPKDSNIFASEYQLYLPSKEQLRQKILEIEAEIKFEEK